MIRKSSFLGLLLFLATSLFGQVKDADEPYFVFLTDKDLSCDPTADFDARALARRAKNHVPFPAFEDYDLDPAYVKAVTARVNRPRYALRWLNALTVDATSAQVEELRQLPFVQAVVPFEPLQAILAEDEEFVEVGGSDDSLKFHLLFEHQRNLLGMELAEKQGLTGKGVRIAVFDAGFTRVDTHVAFAELRAAGRIKKTKDFVGGGENVYAHSGHGTAVLSCLAGLYEGRRIGAAVDAEYILARTELNLREAKVEEDHWLAAMEWADREGADMISSSLGYAKPRYEYPDMDGRKTLVSRAAAMAVRKGILVVSSAGNDGSDKFHYIAAPADADSVLTVGASYPMFGFRLPFSSFGPNYRGILKPEISAPGYVLGASKKGGYTIHAGTSFACPLMAGLAACLIQSHPQATNMEIREMIIAAGHTYPYFDYGLGYGVFGLSRVGGKAEDVQPTFEVKRQADTLWFFLDENILRGDTTKGPSQRPPGLPFNYRFVLPSGQLSSYKSFLVSKERNRFGLPPAMRTEGKLEAWFQGYYWKEE